MTAGYSLMHRLLTYQYQYAMNGVMITVILTLMDICNDIFDFCTIRLIVTGTTGFTPT